MTEQSIFQIRPLNPGMEQEKCARLMCTAEPWITLGRSYEESLALFNNPDKENYGAFTGDKLAGFLVLDLNGPFKGYIQSICIIPSQRGKGLGTKLIKFAEGIISPISSNVFICVSDFNEKAKRLYQRLGYEIVGELKDYIIPGHSEILMRKAKGPIGNIRPEY